MKTFKLLPFLTLASIAALLFTTPMFLASCSKSGTSPKKDTTAITGETPFQAAVKDPTIINGKTAYGQFGGAEIGYRVHFTVGGTVTGLGANMATKGTYTVSFWRTADAKLLGRATVNNSDTGKFAYASITPITVKPDTAYSISINIPDGSTQFHWIYTWSPNHDIYPFTKGHVVADQVLDQAYLAAGAGPTYPYDVYPSDQQYIGSSCDFVFVPAAGSK